MSGISSSSRQWIGLAIFLTTGGGLLIWWALCAAIPTTAAPQPVSGFFGYFMALVGGLGLLFAVLLIVATVIS